MSRRAAAVAGRFYPDDEVELRAQIAGFMDEASGRGPSVARPKALIAPHAGAVFSGPVAASAYSRLAGCSPPVRRVVLLGPSHRVAMRGMAVPSVDAFATPLGEVPLDTAGIAHLVSDGLVQVADEPHRLEHSLEVQLPFLIVALGAFVLLPIVVGSCSAKDVADVLDAVWGGQETLVVVSSDLSHYFPYDRARAVDVETRRLIEEGRWRDLDGDHACGYYPLRGLLLAAARRGLRATTVDLRNSGDTAGGKEEVVGYGAWVFA